MKNIDENNKELVKKKPQRNIISTYACFLKSQEKICFSLLCSPNVFFKTTF